MTILQQVLLAFAAFVLFIFAIRLVFALLLRLQLLPILIWLGVGRIYPQWAAEHPFVFYGVLAFFGLLALSCWLRPVVEWVQERQTLWMAERQTGYGTNGIMRCLHGAMFLWWHSHCWYSPQLFLQIGMAIWMRGVCTIFHPRNL